MQWPDFRDAVGEYLGYAKPWNASQSAHVKECVNAGLSRYYDGGAVDFMATPHVWSFLRDVAYQVPLSEINPEPLGDPLHHDAMLEAMLVAAGKEPRDYQSMLASNVAMDIRGGCVCVTYGN